MKTVAAQTLGCKLNFSETSHLLKQFVAAGYEITDFKQRADVYFINTCTVTSVAEKKCRNAIRQASMQNPDAIVAVIGCFAQIDAEQIANIPGVRLILGNDRKHNLLQEIEALWSSHQGSPSGTNLPDKNSNIWPFTLAYSGGDRTRTFFKIQDGCDYFCTYCAIPFARGRSRSASIEETVAMAYEIAHTGTKEVVLTGVNTGTFGIHNGERFIDLLKELDKVTDILRYRISSIEPNLLDDEIIDFVAQSRAFLPHFHIPLQSGSDKVLKMMHRHYDTALYASRLNHIKKVMPDACIAADIITGFNGETEQEFNKTIDFIDNLPISYLHVFPYSDRPNTAALKMDENVPMNVRKSRCLQLIELSNSKRREFINGQIGQERPVLWEHTEHLGKTMQGWTDNYIRLQRSYNADSAGTIDKVVVSDLTIVHNFDCED